MSVGAIQYLLKDMISSGGLAFREQNAKRIEGSDEDFIWGYDSAERWADYESEGGALFGGC